MSHTNSPAEVLRAGLIAAGIGTNGGTWPVYVSHMPDAPDNAICVYDTQGTTDGRNHRTGVVMTHPGFQVRVRALDFATGYAKACAVRTYLDAIRRTLIAIGADSYTIAAATRRGDILPIGREPDGARRESFTINGIVTLAPTA